MGNYLHIKFHNITPQKQEILVAQLSELSVEGFEEGSNYLSAYITEEQFDEKAVQQLTAGEEITITKEIILPKNWNEQWEKNFEPVVIGDFCAIRAHFHKTIPGVQHEIIITPKMSFGTGHHATTYLMIQWMNELAVNGKSVLDFGTGTGVLAILAEKCGATQVVAIDYDDWSIENATENIAVNGCSLVTLQKAESPLNTGIYDVILANINKHVLLANMAVMRQQLKPAGVILVSGLLTGDRLEMQESAEKNDLKVIEEKAKDNWISLLLTSQID